MKCQLTLLLVLSILLIVNANYLRRNLCGPGSGSRHCTGSNHNNGKKNAAQKRQDKRDQQRRKRGVHRTDAMAQRERERKHAHANNRKNNRADPYEPGYGDENYARKREKNRGSRCAKYGMPEDCGWKALDWDGDDEKYDYDAVHMTHYPNL